MTRYTILKTENLPDALKGKPQWMICVVLTAGLLIMTLSAISAGVFIGYTYCYVEHRTGFRATGNISQTQELRIYNVPVAVAEAEAVTEKNTINGALVSSQLVQRLLKIGHTLFDDNHVYLPGSRDEKRLIKLESKI